MADETKFDQSEEQEVPLTDQQIQDYEGRIEAQLDTIKTYELNIAKLEKELELTQNLVNEIKEDIAGKEEQIKELEQALDAANKLAEEAGSNKAVVEQAKEVSLSGTYVG